MIKYTTSFIDKLEDVLEETGYTVRYERGNFQSGWCLLDHKRVVVLNKFLDTEGRVNTLVELIPQLKIDYDKLTLNSQKLYEFLKANHIEKYGAPEQETEQTVAEQTESVEAEEKEADTAADNTEIPEQQTEDTDQAS